MKKNKKSRPQSFIRSIINALLGIKFMFQERTFKILIIAGMLAISLSFYLETSIIDRLLIILIIGFILGTEAINSAFEHILDLIEKEHNIRVAKAKDIAAASVLIFSLTALILSIIIFSKYF